MDNLILTNNQKETNIEMNCSPNSPYTIAEAAKVLRMSDKSVRRQIDRGHLRKCKVFGRVLIPRKDVDTFFEKYSAYAFAQ
jgi:excisionase family DNA binding protein